MRPPRRRSTPAGAPSRERPALLSHASSPTLAIARNGSGTDVGAGASPLMSYLGQCPVAATAPAPRSRSRRRRCPQQPADLGARRWWATKRTAIGESAAAGSAAGVVTLRGRGCPPALPATVSAPASTRARKPRTILISGFSVYPTQQKKKIAADVGIARSPSRAAAVPALRAPGSCGMVRVAPQLAVAILVLSACGGVDGCDKGACQVRRKRRPCSASRKSLSLGGGALLPACCTRMCRLCIPSDLPPSTVTRGGPLSE